MLASALTSSRSLAVGSEGVLEMKRNIMLVAVVTLIIAMMMAPSASAVGQNPPTSCGFGSFQSAATQSESNEFGNGIGKNVLRTFDANPGQYFQYHRTLVADPTCHLVDPERGP